VDAGSRPDQLAATNAMPDDAKMSANALLDVLGWIRATGIQVWLDGGWGVDALLETETRPHKDVDLIVARAETEPLTKLLEQHGFRENPGGRPENFVMSDNRGREIDIHVVEFDAEGNGNYRMENGELWVFPARGFTGRGRVNGVEVRCLSPEIAVACHASGYVPKEKDFADMEGLARRFGVELPPQLRRPVDLGAMPELRTDQ
jgi:lincosamide nucleotidyltransferase A/C/D/E